MASAFHRDPIPADPDEVLGWVGLGVGGISGLSGAETSVGAREGWGGGGGRYSPVTKALLLRRANTDCRMNREILAATFC